jgi:hypothetical protein
VQFKIEGKVEPHLEIKNLGEVMEIFCIICIDIPLMTESYISNRNFVLGCQTVFVYLFTYFCKKHSDDIPRIVSLAQINELLGNVLFPPGLFSFPQKFVAFLFFQQNPHF